MSGLAYITWFPGDFLKSTRGWSVTAKGVYRELLDAQWDQDGLPAAPDELRLLIGATEAEWTEGWKRCEVKFPLAEDGKRRNHRLEEHRQKALGKHHERVESGRKGGRSAQAQLKQSSKLSSSMPSSSSSSSSSQSPSPSQSQSPSAAAAEEYGLQEQPARTEELAEWLQMYNVRIQSPEEHQIAARWIGDGIDEPGRLLRAVAYVRYERSKPYPETIFAAYLDPILRSSAASNYDHAHVERMLAQIDAPTPAESTGSGLNDDAMHELHAIRATQLCHVCAAQMRGDLCLVCGAAGAGQ